VRDQHAVHFAFGILNHTPGEFLVVHAAYALKDMAERAVAKIVEQGGDDADGATLAIQRDRLGKLVENFPRRFHHAKAVAVAGMVGAGVSKRGHAKLADAAETLELDAVDQSE
jgi:hypothetical protein